MNNINFLRRFFYDTEKGFMLMTAALDRLTAEVAKERSAVASVTALVQGLADQIRNNVDDSDALNKLADDIDDQTNQLAQAVTSNTPSATTAPSTDSGSVTSGQ